MATKKKTTKQKTAQAYNTAGKAQQQAFDAAASFAQAAKNFDPSQFMND